jgi:hypothetical protein
MWRSRRAKVLSTSVLRAGIFAIRLSCSAFFEGGGSEDRQAELVRGRMEAEGSHGPAAGVDNFDPVEGPDRPFLFGRGVFDRHRAEARRTFLATESFLAFGPFLPDRSPASRRPGCTCRTLTSRCACRPRQPLPRRVAQFCRRDGFLLQLRGPDAFLPELRSSEGGATGQDEEDGDRRHHVGVGQLAVEPPEHARQSKCLGRLRLLLRARRPEDRPRFFASARFGYRRSGATTRWRLLISEPGWQFGLSLEIAVIVWLPGSPRAIGVGVRFRELSTNTS